MIRSLPDSLAVAKAYRHLHKTYLQPVGWEASNLARKPIDADENILPWITYPALEFLDAVLDSGFRVFEFGGGYSTLWWAPRVGQVTAVDHDPDWAGYIEKRLDGPNLIYVRQIDQAVSANVKSSYSDYFSRKGADNFSYDEAMYIRRGLEDQRFLNYVASIRECDGPFDIIVIDGMARRLCAFEAIHHLSKNGIIVFDNSNRSDYELGYNILVESGFRPIPFWGLVPGADFPSCTSMFVRSLDALPRSGYKASYFHFEEY